MRNRFIRLFSIAMMLVLVLAGMNFTASASTDMNSFTFCNMTDTTIVEVYIYLSGGGRGMPRNYQWLHSGSSDVINFYASELRSYGSWKMSVGFKSNSGVYTKYLDIPTPAQLVDAGFAALSINSQGEYVLNCYSPYNTNQNNSSYSSPSSSSSASSIEDCMRMGLLEAHASSWYRQNNPSVHPSRMLDGDITTSWDSDDEKFPDFWFTTKDGKEYTVQGMRIVNGKYNEYYFYRNGRVCEMKMYVDGRYIQTIKLDNQRGVYQTVWLDEPVTGSEFFFHVSRVYQSEHETRDDLCISEVEFF